MVDVALGERLGGARERDQAAREVAGEREGQRERDEQRQRADDQRQALAPALALGKRSSAAVRSRLARSM